MKYPLSAVSGLAAYLAMTATSFAQNEIDTGQLTALMSGAQEVPEVATAGTGSIVLDFDEAFTQATFALNVTGTNPVIAAHLHCARAGENGPIVVTLFTSSTPEGDPPADALAQGAITTANITDPAGDPVCGVPINNIAALFAAIREGLIYANVHTSVNPDGEIRGQVFSNDCLRVATPETSPTSPSPPTNPPETPAEPPGGSPPILQ